MPARTRIRCSLTKLPLLVSSLPEDFFAPTILTQTSSSAVVIETFQRVHTADESLFALSSSLDELKEVASALEGFDLHLKDLLVFAIAPVDVELPGQRHALQRMAEKFAKGRSVKVSPNIEGWFSARAGRRTGTCRQLIIASF